VKRIVSSSPSRRAPTSAGWTGTPPCAFSLHRFASAGQGDVKRLKGKTEELRLRVGDYRIRFTEEPDALYVNRVLHRSEAYR